MKLIQNILETEAKRIQKSLGLDNLVFYYSTLNEFIETLNNLKKQNLRYPFFFVHSDRVTYSDGKNDVICSVENIVIATLSDQKWTAAVRDLESFKPILLPIYEELYDGMQRNREINIHSHGDIHIHYFYGKEGIVGYEGLIFPDFIDAIQLKNYKFRISKNNNK